MFIATVNKHQLSSPAMATKRLLKNWSVSEMRLKRYPKPEVLELGSLQRVFNATRDSLEGRVVVLDTKLPQLSTVINGKDKFPLNKFVHFYTEQNTICRRGLPSFEMGVDLPLL